MRDAPAQIVKDFGHIGGEARARLGERGARPKRGRSHCAEGERPEPGVVEIVGALDRADMLPAIYFLFSRRDCESAAEQAALMRSQLVRDPSSFAASTTVLAHHSGAAAPGRSAAWTRCRRSPGWRGAASASTTPGCCRRSSDWSRISSRGADGRRLRHRHAGAGRQHAGPHRRRRTHGKYDGVQRRLLLPNEFQQMAGRAGPARPRPGGLRRHPLQPVGQLPRQPADRDRPAAAGAERLHHPLQLGAQPVGPAARQPGASCCCTRACTSSRPTRGCATWRRRSSRSSASSTALPTGCPVGHPDE